MRQFLSILLLPLLLWAKTPLVAVSDLDPHGISRSDAAIISDRLRSELLQTGRVRVLERGEMDRILKEQAFQASGACDRSECAVEIGKLLSVDRMVVGSVGRIGDIYTLSARILDVGTGEVLFGANQDQEGGLDSLLETTVPALAARLADGAASAASGGVVGTGDLFVTVEDPDAALTLDGKPVPGRAPFSLEHVEAGTHVLVARSGSQIGSAQVELFKDDLQRIAISLHQGTGSAKLFSEPAGATVRLADPDGSGQILGSTPVKVDGLEVGHHRIRFEEPGYLDTTVDLEVRLDGIVTLHLGLSPAGSLVLDPVPVVPLELTRGRDTLRLAGRKRIDLPPGTWHLRLRDRAWEPLSTSFRIEQGKDDTLRPQRHLAAIEVTSGIPSEVRIDGISVGTTPLAVDTLEPGSHTVLLSAQGHLDKLQTMVLEPGELQHLDVQMESRFAWLKLRTPVPAAVELDGKPAGNTVKPPLNVNTRPDEPLEWISDTLLPGPHRLRIAADRRVPWEGTLDLSPGSTMIYQAELPWTPEELARRRRDVRSGRRTLLGVLTIGAGSVTAVLGDLWQSHASQARNDASQSGTAASNGGYAGQRQAANSARLETEAAGALTLLAATAFGLSWAF
jgi:hypothetical protein